MIILTVLRLRCPYCIFLRKRSIMFKLHFACRIVIIDYIRFDCVAIKAHIKKKNQESNNVSVYNQYIDKV